MEVGGVFGSGSAAGQGTWRVEEGDGLFYFLFFHCPRPISSSDFVSLSCRLC